MNAPHQHNMHLLAQSEQDGRPDGMQVMVHRGDGYVGHSFSRGFAAWVPPSPTRIVDPRPGRVDVLHPADIHLDAHGLVYCTDFNAGLSVVEFLG